MGHGGVFVRGFAVAAVGATLLAAGRSASGADDPQRLVHARMSARLGLSLAEARDLALRAGRVEVGGRARLAGTIYAAGFRVLPGADVTMEEGTTIFSTGDVAIDAPLRGVPAPRTGKVGANGADKEDYAVLCDQGDVTIGAPILIADGGDGENVNVQDDVAVGGNGGKGGGVLVQCTGHVTISANVVPGRGGRGGSAVSTGSDGAAGAAGHGADATGGNGGKSGDVRIVCDTLEFTTDVNGDAEGKVGLRPGGAGGTADAFAGSGGSSTTCGQAGGAGGAAKATGGNGGLGTDALVEVQHLLPDTFDVRDFVRFDESERPDGGAATATGGAGGSGGPCDVDAGCPDVGPAGGAGAPGGRADAFGGAGGTGGKVGGGTGVLTSRVQSGGETPPGDGGDATATAGAAGAGGNGSPGKAPGAGGAGADGAGAKAVGGRGGSSTLGRKFNQPLGPGEGPLTGGAGGDGVATPGAGSDGGKGGDCCDNPNGKGAKGGKAGKGGKGKGKGGLGGFGFRNGPAGTGSGTVFGKAGKKGARGVNCPLFVTEFVSLVDAEIIGPVIHGKNAPYNFTFSNTNAEAQTIHIEVCCDGNKIFEYDFVVPAKTGATAAVGVSSGFLFITSPHQGHHISIMVKGRTIRTLIINVL